jgi:hypothetical protein
MRAALVLVLLALLAGAGNARAAHVFLAEDGRGAVISLEGRIGAGDAGKLARFMQGAGPRITTLRLRSPGGRAGEAMKIGALVRQYLLATEAPVDEGGAPACGEANPHCVCASACVFVWAAGIHRNERAHLEAHRPGRADGSEPDAPSESEAALRAYFAALETPPELVDFVLSVPPDRLERVPGELVRKASGFVPSIGTSLAARCPPDASPRCPARTLDQMRRLAHDALRETAAETPE